MRRREFWTGKLWIGGSGVLWSGQAGGGKARRGGVGRVGSVFVWRDAVRRGTVGHGG